MSAPESLLKKIAEEEARLARIDKERDEALARLKDLRDRLIGDLPAPTSPKPIPSDWLTFSERIRAASEIPFEVDFVEKNLSRLARRVHGGNDASVGRTRCIGNLESRAARLPFDRVVRIV